jgi:hypothetical protein
MSTFAQQSQPRAGPSHSHGPKITGKGKERQKQLIKSNALKRRKVDEELKGLQEAVDQFVSTLEVTRSKKRDRLMAFLWEGR